MLGLDEKKVIINREKYGSNRITSKKRNSFIGLLIESLGDPIIKILLIALGIKTIFLIQNFDWYETVGIVIAIFIASFISSISEYGSEKAFDKLQEEASKIKCRVRRDGKLKEINIDDIVVDDIVELSTGDKIPADGIIIEGEITVDESSLNGETKDIYKIANSKKTTELYLYRGTVVYSKECLMRVTKVGDDTFYGKMAKELQDSQPTSPLKIKLHDLALTISKIGYICAFLVFTSYLFSMIVIKNNFKTELIMKTITNLPLLIGYILYGLTLAVTIIVVAVPEGLPMMITLVLSSNMKRMLKNNVLVRKLVGIETAGSLNILFTDKTGTLTKGKLEVVEFMSGSGLSVNSMEELNKYPKLHKIVETSLYYNNGSKISDDLKIIGGNITDQALLRYVGRISTNYKIIDRIPFDSKNKYSVTTIYDKGEISLIKGAPEKLLEHCKTYYNDYGIKRTLISNSKIEEKIKQMTNKGIRVLLLCTGHSKYRLDNLTLVGLVFIKDEIREEAKIGVKEVEKAGIKTIMITGDNKETATSIARELGIIKNDSDIVLTGDELHNKTDDEIKKILPNLKVVARSLPQDKSRLVKLSEELGLVVGMTGDGVNDAPALKKADVGFAMGSGTEVAKEASDIVILDNNFNSITKAILFGRTIFKSIRKFIIFQLTVNLCAVSLSIIGPFIGVATPVTVIQMLWINMVMDTIAGIAFSFEPPLSEYMDEKPKSKNEKILNKYMKDEIIFTGIYSSLLCIFFLKSGIIRRLFRVGTNYQYLMTSFFALFIFIGIFNSFNARTNRLNLLAHLEKNKIFVIMISFVIIVQLILIYYGGELFRTSGMSLKDFIMMIIIAFTVVPVDWIRKLYLRSNGIVGGV